MAHLDGVKFHDNLVPDGFVQLDAQRVPILLNMLPLTFSDTNSLK